jgi:DNA modification methylase
MDKKDFKLEITTVWDFPDRGKWATHNAKFRGNFAPQVARNLILRYSREGDLIFDPMVGGGTTVIEAKLLGRRSIGMDINPQFIENIRDKLNFEGRFGPELVVGDVRNISFLKDESIDLVITHPPYLNIIKYSNGKIDGDLSNISGIKKFLTEFEKGVKELYRVLKPNSFCAILIGDTRKRRHYVPLSFYVMELFLRNNFILKEDIIKTQHNCKLTPYWQSQSTKYNFMLIMHEHLFVFRKTADNEDISIYKYSTLNWK